MGVFWGPYVVVLGRRVRFLSPKTCSSLSHQNSCLWFGLEGGLGWEQLGSSKQLCGTWHGSDLPRERQIFPDYPQLVFTALGEFKTRRGAGKASRLQIWGSPQQTLKANLPVPKSKPPNLGRRCPARSPEARATQVTRNRQAQGSCLPLFFHSDLSHSLKTQFLPDHARVPST